MDNYFYNIFNYDWMQILGKRIVSAAEVREKAPKGVVIKTTRDYILADTEIIGVRSRLTRGNHE